MDTETFVDAVREMRDLQKKYFLTRDSHVLTEARRAERVVDRLLENENQLKIF